MIGRVVEVFIPEDIVDVMISDKIGFKVMVDDIIITIVMEQNDENAEIYREDMVKIIMDKDTNEVVSIVLYDGE